jgi:glycosyltransferase involved in cell wall biosynthesis
MYARHRRSRAAVRRSLGIPASVPVVGTVGNFKPQKAPLDFIDMAARVVRAVPRAWFVMAGDGELREESERAALKAGIRKRVVFAGWRRDIPDLLHSLDVFALSSIFEGLPRSVLQAHSAGLPVAATDAGGTAEAVRDGVTGYIVRPRDPSALAHRVIALLKNPARARKMGEKGRKAIGAEFEIRNMLHAIEESYLELARRKGLA